jgi:hypothetical protein
MPRNAAPAADLWTEIDGFAAIPGTAEQPERKTEAHHATVKAKEFRIA